MWVEQPTAILVIHGMGEQNPFDTLDSFARGLLPVLETKAGTALVKQHRLLARGTWNENYISVAPDVAQSAPIDIYEYYWAYEAEREITGGEVLDWLVQVGMLARKYYDANQTLSDYYEAEKDDAFGKRFGFFGPVRFKKYWYLKFCGPFLAATFALLALADPIPWLGRVLPQHLRPLKFGVSFLTRVFGNQLASSFGDVALYTTTDQKSRYYAVRQRILGGGVEKVRQLLTQTQPVEYRRIILVGHSLGSVIAYDIINRINHDLNVGSIKWADGKEAPPEYLAEKLKGLVTFGSPLDKIAFFLRSRAKEAEHLKRQLQANFHSFRAKHWDPRYQPPPQLALQDGILPYLDDIVWFNFWNPKDPIAGALDFYLVDYCLDSSGKKVDVPIVDGKRGMPDFPGNIKVLTDHKSAWKAHGSYWQCVEMYQRIVNEVIF